MAVGFLQSPEWRQYLKGDSSQRIDFLYSEVSKQLTPNDYAEVLKICGSNATPEEKDAALELAYNACCFVLVAQPGEEVVKAAAGQVEGALLDLMKKRFPDESSRIAAFFLNEVNPETVPAYLVYEIPNAVLAAIDGKTLAHYLGYLGDFARVHLKDADRNPAPPAVAAVRRLYQLTCEGGAPARAANLELANKRLDRNKTVQALRVKWQKEASITPEQVRGFMAWMEDASAVTPEAILEQANRWARDRSRDALEFLYRRCVLGLRAGAPMRLIFDLLGEPSTACRNTCWYYRESLGETPTPIVLHQNPEGMFLRGGVSDLWQPDAQPLAEKQDWKLFTEGKLPRHSKIFRELKPSDIATMIDYLAVASEERKQDAMSQLYAAVLNKIPMPSAEKERLVVILKPLMLTYPQILGMDAFAFLYRLGPSLAENFLLHELDQSRISDDLFPCYLQDVLKITPPGDHIEALRSYANLPGGRGEQAMRLLKARGVIDQTEVEALAAAWRDSRLERHLNELWTVYLQHQKNTALAPLVGLLGEPTERGQKYLWYASVKDYFSPNDLIEGLLLIQDEEGALKLMRPFIFDPVMGTGYFERVADEA
jgi:hypothetical protein